MTIAASLLSAGHATIDVAYGEAVLRILQAEIAASRRDMARIDALLGCDGCGELLDDHNDCAACAAMEE